MAKKNVTYRVFIIKNEELTHDATDLKDVLRTKLANSNVERRLIPVKEGDMIELGDRPLRIIDIPGHTPGSIAILDEKYRVLISGDSVEDGNVFMFGIYRNIDLYIESLRHLAKYDGQYDEVYAMHGSIPVKPDITGKLIEGAEQIRRGEAKGQKVNLFGNDVLLYKFPYAGFLCEDKNS